MRNALLQKEKSQGFRERLQSINDILLKVQDTMGQVAVMCERVKKYLLILSLLYVFLALPFSTFCL